MSYNSLSSQQRHFRRCWLVLAGMRPKDTCCTFRIKAVVTVCTTYYGQTLPHIPRMHFTFDCELILDYYMLKFFSIMNNLCSSHSQFICSMWVIAHELRCYYDPGKVCFWRIVTYMNDFQIRKHYDYLFIYFILFTYVRVICREETGRFQWRTIIVSVRCYSLN